MPEGFIPMGFSHRRGLNTDFLQSELARLQESGQFNATHKERQYQFDEELGFRRSEADRDSQQFDKKLGQDRDIFDKDLEERKRASEADEDVASRNATSREEEVNIAATREGRIAKQEEARIGLEKRRVAVDEAAQTLADKRFAQNEAEYQRAIAEGDVQKAIENAGGAIRAAIMSDPTLTPEQAVSMLGISQDDPMYGQLLGEAATALQQQEIHQLKVEEIQGQLERGEIDNATAEAELENFLIETDPELAQEMANIEVETSAEAGPKIQNRNFLQQQLERDSQMADQMEATIAPMLGILEQDIGEEPEKHIEVPTADGGSVKQVNPEWTMWDSMRSQQELVGAQMDTIEKLRESITGYNTSIQEIESELAQMKIDAQGQLGKARVSARDRVKDKRKSQKKKKKEQ